VDAETFRFVAREGEVTGGSVARGTARRVEAFGAATSVAFVAGVELLPPPGMHASGCWRASRGREYCSTTDHARYSPLWPVEGTSYADEDCRRVVRRLERDVYRFAPSGIRVPLADLSGLLVHAAEVDFDRAFG